ncbi:hypothetical protein MCAP1_003168 [Malassezia caprae]|uniref:Uncharacterized protein n=1 Tax=Malassezia caprae TaxID=1381934 RepID=A0AAF0EAU2_9BASI|nr:hypothetical protein MCAP1_003168 [Malassezia caprae]
MRASPPLTDMLGLDDDSDDEALRTPRRSRRAASQHANYRDKLSLTRPADEHVQRRRGMPRPMIVGSSKYSLEALSRDKARRERRGLLPHQLADIDELITQMDVEADTIDPHAALWTTLEAPEAQHLARLVQSDQGVHTSRSHRAATFWHANEPPVMEIEPSEAAVLARLGAQPSLSPEQVAPIMRLCLARDESLAHRARATLATRSDCVGRLVAPLLVAMGAHPDVVARATSAPVAPLSAWSMPSPRSQALMRLWQLLACCTFDSDMAHLLPILVYMGVAAPLDTRPWLRERVLMRVADVAVDHAAAAAGLVHLGHALRTPEQVALVRAIPSGLRAVRACVAWHLALQTPYTQLRPDLSALARVCEPHAPTHDYDQLGMSIALLSLALSDLLAHWAASDARAVLQTLTPVMQSVWALHRRIPDARGGADMSRS